MPLCALLCWSHWPTAYIVLLSVGAQQTEAHYLQSGVAVVIALKAASCEGQGDANDASHASRQFDGSCGQGSGRVPRGALDGQGSVGRGRAGVQPRSPHCGGDGRH